MNDQLFLGILRWSRRRVILGPEGIKEAGNLFHGKVGGNGLEDSEGKYTVIVLLELRKLNIITICSVKLELVEGFRYSLEIYFYFVIE